jgi:hypothetical protein
MAFTVEDLRDLAELLRAHPEWREPLWAMLASEEVRRMPERMERGFQRAARLILALYRAQRQHYKEFVAHRAETDRRFAELAEALRILTERVDRVERRQEDHSRDLGELKSMRLEALYAEKPAVLFRSLLRRAGRARHDGRGRPGRPPGRPGGGLSSAGGPPGVSGGGDLLAGRDERCGSGGGAGGRFCSGAGGRGDPGGGGEGIDGAGAADGPGAGGVVAAGREGLRSPRDPRGRTG